MTETPSPSQRLRWGVVAVWLAVTVPTVAFYWWTGTSSNGPPNWRPRFQDHYNLLAEGYLKGHLYLAIQPPPEMLALANPYDPALNARYRLHDGALYHGRYYLYFGPVPALTLHVPWRLFSGYGPPPVFAVVYFVVLGYVFSSLLLVRLLREARIDLPLGLLAVIFAALGLAQFTVILCRRTMMYEIAIAAGFCFLMAGLYFLALSIFSKAGPAAFPIAAGVCLGLSPGCRPHLAVAVAALAVLYYAFLTFSRRLRGRALAVEIGRFVAPIAICGLLLAWYNYARFANALEFGIKYQLTASLDSVGVSLGLKNALADLKVLFLLPPMKLNGFPYFQMPYVKLIPQATFGEATIGVAWLMPLCILGSISAPFMIGRKCWVKSRVSWALAALFVAAIPTLIFLCLTGTSNLRYQVDYTPELWVAALFASLVVARGIERVWTRRALTALVVVLCLYGMAAAALLSIWGYDGGLPLSNPVLYQAIASWFPKTLQLAFLILYAAVGAPVLIVCADPLKRLWLRVRAPATELLGVTAETWRRWSGRVHVRLAKLSPPVHTALVKAAGSVNASLVKTAGWLVASGESGRGNARLGFAPYPRWLVFAIWLAATAPVVAFYWWTGTSSSEPVWHTEQHDHYNSLAEGYLSGHLYMAERPQDVMLALLNPYDPNANGAYRKQDASLYEGKYYLPSGPVPVLMLHLPWRAFSRFGPPPVLAVFYFVVLGHIFSSLLLVRLLRAARVHMPLTLLTLIFAALGLSQFTLLLFRRPAMYEIASAAGFCLLMAGLYFLALSIFSRSASPTLTMAAGFCLGLAPGCRSSLVPAVAALLVLYFAFLTLQQRIRGRALLAESGRLVAPVVICAALLVWYNYARFGDALEFGQKYQLKAHAEYAGQNPNPSDGNSDLTALLFFPPKRITGFPFFRMAVASHYESTVGVTQVMPLCLLGCMAGPFIMWRKRWMGPRSSWVVAALIAAAIPTLFFLSLSGNSSLQSQVDYTPELWVATLFLSLVVARGVESIWLGRCFTGLIVALCIYGAIAVALLSISGYEGSLVEANPDLFHKLAAWFGG
jgi:hypothetical protein